MSSMSFYKINHFVIVLGKLTIQINPENYPKTFLEDGGNMKWFKIFNFKSFRVSYGVRNA